MIIRVGLNCLLALSLLLSQGLVVAAVSDLSITDRQLVSKQRVSRSAIDYTYTLTVHNAGAPLIGVVATVSSLADSTVIQQAEMVFGTLNSGSTQSTETFVLRQDRRVPFDFSDLVFMFTVEGVISFKNISVDIPFPKVFGDYGSLWGDFNHDNLLDLIYMQHGKGVLMLQQNKNGKFVDVSNSAGLKYSDWQYPQQGDRHGGSCADYNNDGNVDLFIAHGAMRGDTLGVKYDELLQGNGDFTFVDVTHSAGTLNHFGRSRIGRWVDYDNDGWLDLYIANLQTNNVMYKNNGDGTFTDVTDTLGVGLLQSKATWADYDMDGNMDLLLAWPLRLLRNTGQGYFEDVTKKSLGYEWIFGFGLAWGDFDNDADMDVFVSRLGLRSLLLINNGGKFSPLENYAGNLIDNLGGYDWDYVEGEKGTGISWGDFDNDGDIDLFHVRSDGFTLYNNRLYGKFIPQRFGEPLPAIKEKYHGDAAVGDFNGDGLLDVAIDYNQGYVLLKNDSLVSGNWLKIKFNGVLNNAMGIGNKIWITKNGQLVAYREYTGASGGLNSFGCGPVHVGLGEAKTVDIKVQWPNGYTSNYYNVSSNKVVEIVDY